MKKAFNVLFIASAAVLFLSSAACKGKSVGGYESMYDMLNADESGNTWVNAEDTTVTEKVRSVFVKATSGTQNLFLSPVALIATKQTDGMQYCILCSEKKSTTLKVVYIYEGPDGKCKLMGMDDYEPGK